jgi:hypothetical protein
VGNIRVIRRNGGVRITQGRSFILAGPDELADLIRDLIDISQDGSPERADTVNRIGNL